MRRFRWTAWLVLFLAWASPVLAKAPAKKYKPPVKIEKSRAKHKRITPKKRPIKNKVKKRAYSKLKKKVLPTKKTQKPSRLIVVDPGHGGFDFGATSHSSVEKKLCLSTALLLKNQLNALGYRVVMTRTRDIFIPLEKRVQTANTVRAHLYVSIHFNAAKNPTASGLEVYYHHRGDNLRIARSKKLATEVLSRMLQRTGALTRGVKKGNFYVIRETKMPSILVEGGFITHPRERDLLGKLPYREKLARSIAEGIDKYFAL